MSETSAGFRQACASSIDTGGTDTQAGGCRGEKTISKGIAQLLSRFQE